MKKIITTEKGPRAIGPYSQAVVTNGYVFVSGQIPLDPQTGELVEGDIREQVERVLLNLSAILEASGSGLGQVVKTTVFLADMNDFTAMNEVYGRFFVTEPPARSTITVARLPREARVKIEAIAVIAQS